MSALSPYLRRLEGDQLGYWCPGCNEMHVVQIGSEPGPRWTWDGNAERPTFTPSILIRSGHFARAFKPGDSCWCTWEAEAGEPAPFKCSICHAFVRDGQIQFLTDCTHDLAGKTVPLPAWPEVIESC